MENRELIEFVREYSNKEFSGIYKTNEFQNVDAKFFLDKNYTCKYQFVDIIGNYTQTLIEYSNSLYLFFIEEDSNNELYIFYNVDSKNEFTMFIRNLKNAIK